MAHYFESKILGRLVTIRPNASGRYEISMQGRGGLEVRPETFGNLDEAKIGAHGFAIPLCKSRIAVVESPGQPSSTRPEITPPRRNVPSFHSAPPIRFIQLLAGPPARF